MLLQVVASYRMLLSDAVCCCMMLCAVTISLNIIVYVCYSRSRPRLWRWLWSFQRLCTSVHYQYVEGLLTRRISQE